MQWQVKISSNLGDDVQYLVLVASAATKVKIPAGPARLHIQNHRFCLTTGVPPRLAGMWNIAHLRFVNSSKLIFIKIHQTVFLINYVSRWFNWQALRGCWKSILFRRRFVERKMWRICGFNHRLRWWDLKLFQNSITREVEQQQSLQQVAWQSAKNERHAELARWNQSCVEHEFEVWLQQWIVVLAITRVSRHRQLHWLWYIIVYWWIRFQRWT